MGRRRTRSANGDRRLPSATRGMRSVLADARAAMAEDNALPSLEELVDEARDRRAQDRRPLLRTVINATGVILQTNLGRAPLSDRAMPQTAIFVASHGWSDAPVYVYSLDTVCGADRP